MTTHDARAAAHKRNMATLMTDEEGLQRRAEERQKRTTKRRHLGSSTVYAGAFINVMQAIKQAALEAENESCDCYLADPLTEQVPMEAWREAKTALDAIRRVDRMIVEYKRVR